MDIVDRIRLKLGENENEYEGEAQDDLARHALDGLVRDGLAEAESIMGRTFWSLTEAGRSVLDPAKNEGGG